LRGRYDELLRTGLVHPVVVDEDTKRAGGDRSSAEADADDDGDYCPKCGFGWGCVGCGIGEKVGSARSVRLIYKYLHTSISPSFQFCTQRLYKGWTDKYIQPSFQENKPSAKELN
jgi:hypothetical protein